MNEKTARRRPPDCRPLLQGSGSSSGDLASSLASACSWYLSRLRPLRIVNRRHDLVAGFDALQERPGGGRCREKAVVGLMPEIFFFGL
jgi:hypothetical protein